VLRVNIGFIFVYT